MKVFVYITLVASIAFLLFVIVIKIIRFKNPEYLFLEKLGENFVQDISSVLTLIFTITLAFLLLGREDKFREEANESERIKLNVASLTSIVNRINDDLHNILVRIELAQEREDSRALLSELHRLRNYHTNIINRTYGNVLYEGIVPEFPLFHVNTYIDQLTTHGNNLFIWSNNGGAPPGVDHVGFKLDMVQLYVNQTSRKMYAVIEARAKAHNIFEVR